MKRLLCAISAVIFALQPTGAVAVEATPWDTPGPLFSAAHGYFPSKVSRDKRIAVIRDSRNKAFATGTQQSTFRNRIRMLGNVYEAFEDGGGEVHFYDSDWFEAVDADGGHSRHIAFKDIGSYYAAVIIEWPFDHAQSTPDYAGGHSGPYRCFYRADSTNGQLILAGGQDDGALRNWATDSTYGIIDTDRNSSFSTIWGAGIVSTNAYANRDTLWFTSASTGRRTHALPTGIDSVRRLFRPFTLTGVAFSHDGGTPAESTAKMPTIAGDDSTAGPDEYLGPIFKAHFTTGYTGGSVTNPPRETYYFKVKGSANVSQAYPQLLWALLARFTTVRPLNYAYQWDDMGDLPFNNTTQVRARAEALDSLVTYLSTNYGVKISSAAVDPLHALQYSRGQRGTFTRGNGTVDNETAWSGTSYAGFFQRFPYWSPHSHDSTSAISANLTGRSFGYAAANGSLITQGAPNALNVHAFTHRFPNRLDASVSVGSPAHYGILQRIQYFDSIRAVVSPGSHLPPYIDFPNNYILPIGYKLRAAPAYASYQSIATAAGTPECPIDSLLWALGNGMHIQSGGTIYLRGAIPIGAQPNSYNSSTIWPWGDGAIRNWSMSADRDSMVADSPFSYPGERYTARLGDYVISARFVGATILGAASNGAYKNNAAGNMSQSLGLTNNLMRFESSDYINGETPAPNGDDYNGVFGTSTIPVHYFAFRNGPRAIYQHPLAATANGFGTGGDPESFILTFATMVRALNNQVAGRTAIRCVYGWEVYDR